MAITLLLKTAEKDKIRKIGAENKKRKKQIKENVILTEHENCDILNEGKAFPQ